jgi:NAD(P)H-dependent FMN reductase
MSQPPVNPTLNVLVVAASFRQGSLNHRLANRAARACRDYGANVDLATLAAFPVPLYNGDLETAEGIPAGAEELKRRLIASDAFVIASPEYNGSMPGTIKNLIDWVSRFRPQPFDGHQALLVSASPALAGGNRGLWALRVPLEHLGARVYPDMFSLSMAHKAFDGDEIADAALRSRFEKTVQSFLSLAEAARHYPCIKRAWVEFLGEPPGVGEDRVDPPS